MSTRDIFIRLFDFSINTYYLWKKQNRPIINLLEKYFKKEELEEFLETGKIEKFEKSKNSEFLQHIVLHDFFYLQNTNNPKNRNFVSIFEKFKKYIDNLSVKEINEKQKNKPFLKNKAEFLKFLITKDTVNVNRINHKNKILYYDKAIFMQFLILDDEIDKFEKVEYIEQIANLKEIEFFIILTEYKNFLEKEVR